MSLWELRACLDALEAQSQPMTGGASITNEEHDALVKKYERYMH